MTEPTAFIQKLLQEHYPCGELRGLVFNPGTGFSGADLYRVETATGRYALRGWESSLEQRQRLEQAFSVIRYAGEQGGLTQTHQVLAGLFDIRTPVSMTDDECDLAAEIVREAIQSVISDRTGTGQAREATARHKLAG